MVSQGETERKVKPLKTKAPTKSLMTFRAPSETFLSRLRALVFARGPKRNGGFFFAARQTRMSAMDPKEHKKLHKSAVKPLESLARVNLCARANRAPNVETVRRAG